MPTRLWFCAVESRISSFGDVTDLRQPTTVEVADGVFRLGTGLNGFYLLEEGGKCTLVDGAFPRYFSHLTNLLSELGTNLDAIEAQVLTHHHADHRGMTERVRKATGGTVWIHHQDKPHLEARQPPPLAPLWRPPVFKAFAHMFRHGIAWTPAVLEASTFDEGEVLDVPGRPRVVHVPGHTSGNCALDLGGGVVITGDALITVDIYTWDVRPCIPASFFNDDSEQAIESLSRLESLSANLLLPGHGPVWDGPIADAVATARSVGVY